jgi:hypothetical protein
MERAFACGALAAVTRAASDAPDGLEDGVEAARAELAEAVEAACTGTRCMFAPPFVRLSLWVLGPDRP